MAAIIFSWLDRIGLGFAVPNFAAMGVDTPQALMNIDVSSYDALGIYNGEERQERQSVGLSAPLAAAGAALSGGGRGAHARAAHSSTLSPGTMFNDCLGSSSPLPPFSLSFSFSLSLCSG